MLFEALISFSTFRSLLIVTVGVIVIPLLSAVSNVLLTNVKFPPAASVMPYPDTVVGVPSIAVQGTLPVLEFTITDESSATILIL